MIDPKFFFDGVSSRGVGFFAGVPDSLLSNLCAYLDGEDCHGQHLITANEGNAIALAMGYHFSTGRVALVYMQNSGLGNAVNPLTSLADPEVYRVPMLLVIGWRGEPGIADEPQHVKQGRITLNQLDVLEIPHWILDSQSNLNKVLDEAFHTMHQRNAPVAIVVRKNTFANYGRSIKRVEISSFIREDALGELIQCFSDNNVVISTTGKTSRELFELRARYKQKQSDFLTVGGMGHAASIALGVAIGNPSKKVVCLDGDGSLLMHMGCLPVIANYKPHHFMHVLLNNGSHESVGGQDTSVSVMDFNQLAKGVGYVAYECAYDAKSLRKAWARLASVVGPVLLEIKIKNGSRDDLGRPTNSAEENKRTFMEALSG